MKKKKWKVVPYIGTWIETRQFFFHANLTLVVPYIGTWIETSTLTSGETGGQSRTLYRYVD